MVALAKDEPGVQAEPDAFDVDPFLFNCENGTLNLETGELLPHDPSRLIMKMAGTIFDPEAECPKWNSFLKQIMRDDQNTISYLKRAVGYSLSGSAEEQALFFLFGDGANGKSTFIKIISRLLGEYAARTKSESLYEKRNNEGANNDVARLMGMRLVSASELDGKHLNESLIKDFTGGDTLVARFLHKEFFEYDAQFKLWMYGNKRPEIKGTDEGIWRRVKLIPFTYSIPTSERDRGFPEKLSEELPGILNWAVEGFREWRQSGLGEPLSVKEATQDYREEMDYIQLYIDECCACGPELRHRSRLLYENYAEWCDKSRSPRVCERDFVRELQSRGFDKQQESKTKRAMIVGMSVRVNDSNGDEL